MTVDEMDNHEASKGSLAAWDGEYTEEAIDDDEQAYMDVQEAIQLLQKAKTMLDYFGDSDMIKTITKRERDSIERVSGKIKGYLDNVSPIYTEDEEVGGE